MSVWSMEQMLLQTIISSSPIRMEGRIPHQGAREGWPQLVFQLQRNNTTVHPRQGVQSSATKQDERCSWPPALGPAGWLSQGQGLHRPDCNTAHHPRTVLWMELPSRMSTAEEEEELPSLWELYWLWEGIWQSGPTEPLETAETLWRTREDHHHH